MNTFPFVVLLSDDTVLADLLRQLLAQDRFLFRGVQTAEEVFCLCTRSEGRPAAVLVDVIERFREAEALLAQAPVRLPGDRPALLLLTGSMTPDALFSHGWVDGVLSVPLKTADLVGVLGKHARNLVIPSVRPAVAPSRPGSVVAENAERTARAG